MAKDGAKGGFEPQAMQVGVLTAALQELTPREKRDPDPDLAVASALLSAREDIALPPEAAVFGEISLSGALRPVSQTENRLKEAQKLGFTSAIVPAGGKPGGAGGMRLDEYGDLTAFVGDIFGAG